MDFFNSLSVIVPMFVRMPHSRIDVLTMTVLMVLIVNMFVLVLQRLMRVLMLVGFREMKPDAHGHQCSCEQ